MQKKKTLLSKKAQLFVYSRALQIVLILCIGIIIILNPKFLQVRVLVDILSQSSVRIIMALGLLLPLIVGGTDLAGGKQLALSAVVITSMLQTATYSKRFFPNLPQVPVFVPFLIVAVILAIVGICSGYMIAKLNIPPFIATLSMSLILNGATLLYIGMMPNDSQPIGGLREDFTALGTYRLFGTIPILIVFALIFIILTWILMNKTSFGKKIYAVGGNRQAAEVAGINSVAVIIAVYVIESLYVGFAGALEAARTLSANAAYGTGYEFDAIASCVVGGVSLRGGLGKVSGVILGVIIFTVISYGLAFIGVNPHWQLIIRGGLICIAVAFDMKKLALQS